VTDDSAAAASVEAESGPDLDWTVTDDPEAALAAAEAGEVDCLVTAQDLPDRTGVEVAAAARDRDAHLPVVLFAAGDAGGERVAAAATRAGVDEYLSSRPDRDDVAHLARRVRAQVADARERRRAARLADRFERTLERTTDAVYAVDGDWRIEYANERMAARVDRDPDDLVGAVLWDAFPALLETTLPDRYREAVETGEPVSFEEYLDEPFDYWVEVRAFPDEEGLTVFSREVTDRRRREADLLVKSAAMEASMDGIAVLDADFEYTYINEAHAEIFGYDRADLRERSWRLLYDDPEADRLEREGLAALETDGEWRGEAVGRRRDGSTVPHELTLSRLETGGVVCIVRDVTERKRRERELARYEALVEHMNAGAAVVGGDGRVEYVNSQIERLGPIDRADLLGARAVDLVDRLTEDAASIRSFEAAVAAAREAGDDPDPVEVTMETAAGDRTVEYLFSSVQYDDETKAVVVAKDVTERVETTRQLRRERDALRELQTVMADGSRSTAEQLTALLEVGRRVLGLPIGVVSEVEGTDYRIRAVDAPDAAIEVGDRYDLAETFCERVVEAEGVHELLDAPEAGETDHPAYREAGLAAYLGVPLFVDDELYGTLNFSARCPREEPFGEFERTFVELLAELVSTIVGRDRSRTALEATNRRLESLIDAAPLAIFELDREGRVRLWNRGSEELFGWSSDEVVGETNPLVPPSVDSESGTATEPGSGSDPESRADPEAEPDDEVRGFHARVVNGERVRGVELRRRTKDGDRLDLLASAAPLPGVGNTDTDTDPTRAGSAIVVMDDITDQKRLERRLRALQETARRLTVATSPAEVGKITVEAAAEVLDLELTAVWQYDEREDALVPVETTESARTLLDDPPRFSRGEGLAWEVFESGETRGFDDLAAIDDEALRNPDTLIRSEVIVPLGEYGVLISGSTARQEFSDADVDLLSILGASAEAALSRTEREAQLQRQNERLDEFSSVVAHDLRNPLTVAQGYLDLARETGEAEPLERVAAAHERIEHLVDDLLQLARGGEPVTQPDRVALGDLVPEAWEYVDTPEADLAVDGPLPTVAGDRSRLTQLFENLFRNAVEHGGEDVTVSVGPVQEGDAGADGAATGTGTGTAAGEGSGDADGVFVEDDGAGIPPADREAVFEHGFSTGAQGTGYGLSIVADIVRAHGWSVTVTEGRDGGARFEIAFEDTGGATGAAGTPASGPTDGSPGAE
jgi:PAS domain S-box-containing protein